MADSDSDSRVVNVDDLPPTGTDDDGSRWTRVARAAGARRLGCTLEEIAPGGSPTRYHYHAGNEEALFVLSGTGTLRTPTGRRPIRAGDYAAFPTGEAGGHTVENTGNEVLRCLFFSTMNDPDVVVYPDENTMAVSVGAAPGSDGDYDIATEIPLDVE